MNNAGFDELRHHISMATRKAFSELMSSRSEERFYAFALYANGDGTGICPSANSCQAYDRKQIQYADDSSFDKADIVGNFRWSPFDWKYDCSGSDAFNEVNKLINDRGKGSYSENDHVGFVNFKAMVFSAMVLALAEINTDGFFGTRESRRLVTIFCSTADSECAPWLEADSARRLNPQEVFEVFRKERIYYISNDFGGIASEDDEVYNAYLAFVTRS